MERYLRDEPVEAARPSRGYRLRKFVRRNKGGVIAAGLVLAALVLGLAGTTAGMVWALQERDAKEEAHGQAVKNEGEAVAAAELAQGRLGELEKANDILGSIFVKLNPREIEKEGKPLGVVLGERLERAAQLDAQAVGDPLTVASLQSRLGGSLDALGYTDKAIPLLEQALATREALLGRDDPKTLITMNLLALSYSRADRHDKAFPLIREVVDRQKKVLGPGNRETIVSLSILADEFRVKNQRAEYLELCKEARQLAHDHLGPTDPETLVAVSNLALAYREVNQPDAALPLLKEAVALQTAVIGATKHDTLAARSNLGLGYFTLGRYREAIDEWEQTLNLAKVHLPSSHPTTLSLMHNLGIGYARDKRWDDAVTLLKATVDLRRKKLGDDHIHTLATMSDMGAVCLDARRPQEAVDVLGDLLRLTAAKRGPNHAATHRARGLLARAYLLAGRPAEGLPLLAEFLAAQRKELGAGSPRLAGILAQAGLELTTAGQHAEAERVLRESLDIRGPKEPDAWTTFDTHSLLGGSLLGQKKYAEAEPHLLKGYHGMKQREGKIAPGSRSRLAEAADRLVALYTALGNPDKAEEWRAERRKYPAAVAPPPRPVGK